MSGLLLVLPDFLVILLGVFLRARFFTESTFWLRTEKLVFYVLLPAMLFLSVAGSTVALGDAAIFLAAGVLSMSLAAGLAWGIRYLIRADDVTHASVFQCGFRFNSYIGFALAARIGGDEALALLALLIAVWVPISNALATAELARAVAKADGVGEGAVEGVQDGGEKNGKAGTQPRTELTGRALLRKTLRGVVTNPLILATVGGLLWKALGLPLPSTLVQTLKHLGDASLALGLLCIGAGLTAGSPSEVRAAHRRRHLRAARCRPRRGAARHERRRLLLSAPSHGSGRRASLCGASDRSILLRDGKRHGRERPGGGGRHDRAHSRVGGDVANVDDRHSAGVGGGGAFLNVQVRGGMLPENSERTRPDRPRIWRNNSKLACPLGLLVEMPRSTNFVTH